MYIIDSAVRNLLRGTATDVFLRDGDRTLVRHLDVPTPYFSLKKERDSYRPLVEQEAQKLRDEMEPYLSRFGITPRIEPSGNRYTVVFEGPRGMLRARDLEPALRRMLRQHMHSNPGKILGYQFPPNHEIEFLPDGSFVIGKPISPKLLERGRTGALDIEVDYYDTDHPEIVSCSIATHAGDIVIGSRESTRSSYGDGEIAPFERVKNQQEIVEAAEDFVRRKETDILFIYNASYDLLKMNAVRPFRVGVIGSKTRREGGIPGYIAKWVAEDVQIADPYAMAIGLLGFLPDRKFGTVANFVGVQHGKMDVDIDALLEGSRTNPEKADELYEYNHNDAVGTLEYGDWTLSFAAPMAVDYHTTLNKIFFTSESFRDLYDAEHFKKYHFVRNKKEPVVILSKDGRPKRIDVDVDEEKRKLLKFKTEVGFLDEGIVVYIPMLKKSLTPLSRLFPNVFGYEDEDVKRVLLATIAAEKTSLEMFEDYYRITTSDDDFYEKHGVDRRAFQEMLHTGAELYRPLADYVINFDGSMAFLTRDAKLPDGVIVAGRGPILSVAPARGVAKIEGGNFVTLGMDIRGVRGDKTDLERELTQRLLDACFDGNPLDSLPVVQQAHVDLENDNVPWEKLVYYVAPQIPWQNRSYRTRNTRRSQVIQKYRLRKGDDKRYGIVLIDNKNEKVEENVFLSREYPLAKSDYHDKLRGGTVGDIVNAAMKTLGMKQMALAI